MLDGCQQLSDGMACGGVPQILGGDVQIDLRAGDLSMPEQVTDRNEANPGAHQVRCKRVA